MQKIRIAYNPYKMKTIVLVNGINVCDTDDYLQFREFIESDTPLQTWAEPIPYKGWKGIINELAAEDCRDELEITFEGREIDFEDLKRACEAANNKRDEEKRLEITFKLENELFDAKLAQNIEKVMETLLAEKFSELIKENDDESQIAKKYKNLPEAYRRARNKEFRVVFAGLYSSGKSTLLNALIRHNILPTSDDTCTSRICRIKHNKLMKNQISLECFDAQGEIVVPKEFFDNDEACLTRFWEITPLGSKKSVPESVDTIEICLNLSHLYPSKEMEKEFNLVIIDTPGTDSSEDQEHIKIALDAINNDEKDMVIICADAQKYEDVSLGYFLKAINDTAKDEGDKGDFNDRFLFVLNKSDNIKYTSRENITEKKDKFAQYLMDTKRWGIEEDEDSPRFVPKIFMTSAYIQFAVQMGAANFTYEEMMENQTKQALNGDYNTFRAFVMQWKNKNYYLVSACDIPEYRKEELNKEFEAELCNDESKAVAIQSGMCCIESAIKDYIARYAYPFKVRDLVETFSELLHNVSEMNDYESKKLQERIEALGKGTLEREEVKRQKEEEEKLKAKLALLAGRVNVQKGKINTMNINQRMFSKIAEDLEIAIERREDVAYIRHEWAKDRAFSEDEIESLIKKLDEVFSSAWLDAEKQFGNLTKEYKGKLEEICKELKAISDMLQNSDDYDFNGYKFSETISVAQIVNMDAKSLRKKVETTKFLGEDKVRDWVDNPIKKETYKWWQFGKKIKQHFAAEKVLDWVPVQVDKYKATPIKDYLEKVLVDFKKLCEDTAKNYSEDFENMKNQALKMAEDIPQDIMATTNRISKFVDRMNKCGDDISALEKELKIIREKKEFLQKLVDAISVGGENYV